MYNKIWITGPCGAGKTELAKYISLLSGIPVIHGDKLFFQRNWVTNSEADLISKAKSVFQKHAWIYDAAQLKTAFFDGRIIQADIVIFLHVSRCTALLGYLKRAYKNRGKTRADITDGCVEKVSLHVIKYILWTYWHNVLPILNYVQINHPQKLVVLKSRKKAKMWADNAYEHK